MRIVHLSDFHLQMGTLRDFEKYVIKPLITELKQLHQDKNIDFITFTGDLIDKGGSSFNSVDDAFLEFEIQVIEKITLELGIPKNRFLIVPGNHDIIRNADLKATEIGLRYQLDSLESINELLMNDEEFTASTKRIEKFKEFEKVLYKDSQQTEVTNLETTHIHRINDLNIGIACLNSSWRCYDSDEDPKYVLIGEKQVMDAIDKIEACDVKIALVHHPFDEISNIERKFIRERILTNFDLVLSGHVHREDSFKYSNLYGSTILSTAPASWTGNLRLFSTEHVNGFTLIDYNHLNDCKLAFKKYSHGKLKFIKNTEIGDENGEEHYFFPDTKTLTDRKRIKQIIEDISKVHCATLDEHLLTFNTDTAAPKKINDLFVLPKLIKKNEDVIEENLTELTEDAYTISELCETEENLMLLGVKESGKTILLDKILLEYTTGYEKYGKVPVYLNFEEINGTEIDTVISKYINVGIREIRNGDFELGNIVLLIDNIKFEERYRKILDKLFMFFSKYPNVKSIITCTSNGEEEIPLEAIEEPLFKLFNVIYVKQFNTKEIKELMFKWFADKKEYITKRDNLDKVIKTFTALNLPRTPLAVSMFLWIIEKQENYSPVNNSQMLENFLERLFAKADTYTVYSSTFTYKNKESMLTDIAYKMYEENNIQYRLSYGELRSYVESSLKEKMFDFDVDVILEHFINKGIFTLEIVENIKYIRFKFGCFFQFYLMKNFDKNPTFKRYVLTDDNYLNFIDELDYYSGLKMDDVETVELVINRMREAYENLNLQFEKLPKKIDTPFETIHTIVKKIKEEKIEVINDQHKQTEEDYYESKDLELENQTSKKIEKKLDEINPIQKLERHWILASKLLKNSEEITKKDFKVNAFKDVIRASMSYAGLYKMALIKKEKEKEEELDEQFYLLYKLLPFVHQVVVTQNIGTAKLNLVIEEIISSEEFKGYSDFEKFLYVFIYADLNGKHKFKYINEFIKNTSTYYIKDMIFLKVLEYYYRQDTTADDENKYKNILGDIVEEKGLEESSKRSLHKKGRFISKIEKEKLERNLKSTDELVEVN
ncbi:MAG: metallophosphoesterase [Solibacillus sp.]